jgi:hypothetical protein
VLHLLEDSCKHLNKDVSRAALQDPFPVDNIRREIYVTVNKAVDDPEMVKLNSLIEKDRYP